MWQDSDTPRVHRESTTVQSKRPTTKANLKNDNARDNGRPDVRRCARHKNRVVTVFRAATKFQVARKQSLAYLFPSARQIPSFLERS